MEKIEINKFLPFGESLKDVLLHPSLTSTNLKYLLRQRGVFIESSSDSDTFPLLTCTLLSPLEFEFVKEKIKSKEDNSKIVSRNLEWSSTETLIKVIPDKINLKEILGIDLNRFKIVSQTNFAAVEGNPNKVKMEFKCETNNYNSSWYRAKSEFPGEIVVEKVEAEGKVFMRIIHTSPETLQAADKGVKFLENYFKENNLVSKDKESEKIQYKDFTNESRVQFFLSLTQGSNIFEFQRLTDLDIGPDPNEDPPQEFKKLMSGNVKELKINGNSLHESFFITEKSNHRFIQLAVIETLYNFMYHAASGNCKVRYGFEGFFKKGLTNIEFSVNVSSVNLNDEYMGLNKEKIRVHLLQEFEKFAIGKYYLITRGLQPA